MNKPNLDKLKQLRIKHNYTIEEMSLMLGISKSYYSQIENGRRNLYYKLAVKIARIFDLKPDDIFYID